MRRFTLVALLIVGTALIALAIASVVTTVDAQGPDGREPDTISNNNDDLLLQARALFDTIPDTMPGSARDTPEMVALGETCILRQQFRSTETKVATVAI